MFGDLDNLDNLDDIDLDDEKEPELHKFEVFPTDIWSMGITIYAYFNGKCPFMGNSEYQIMKKAKNEEVPKLDDFSDDLNDLIAQMTNKDPTKRPTVDAVLAHPWFNS